MKESIIEILKRWADNDVNLQSEAAREAIAEEILQNWSDSSMHGTTIPVWLGDNDNDNVYG